MNGQLPSWQQQAFPEHLLGAPAIPILDDIADAPQLAPDPSLAPDIPFKSHTMPLSLEAIDWGAVRPGSRNLTLFNGLRFLAYNSPVSLYPSRESWFAELRSRAFEWAALMPDRRGFPDSEFELPPRVLPRTHGNGGMQSATTSELTAMFNEAEASGRVKSDAGTNGGATTKSGIC